MSNSPNSENNNFFAKRMTTKECSDTGMALVLVCLLGALFSSLREWLVAAVVLLIINMVWPRIYSLPARIWLWFSNLLGSIMSRVILTLVFLIVVTPLAVLRRICGHDPMDAREWKKSTASVFKTRNHTYTAEEIERPY